MIGRPILHQMIGRPILKPNPKNPKSNSDGVQRHKTNKENERVTEAVVVLGQKKTKTKYFFY
jgi:hypothetical protein